MPTWEYAQAFPCELTNRYALSIGGYSENAGRPVRRLELPAGRDVLILGLGEELRIRSAFCPTTPTIRRSFVGGFNCDPHIVEHEGTQRCLEISLAPWATASLFGGSYKEWNGSVVDLCDLWGNEADQLTEQMSEQAEWENRFQTAKRFLTAKFALSRSIPRPEIRWAWEQIERYQGLISIRALAKAIGWSDRHFATRFQDQFGLRPKAAAQRVRFAQAMRVLRSSDSGALADIAAQCGFSDQSHFTREIRRFSGCIPSAIQSARFPDLLGIPAEALST